MTNLQDHSIHVWDLALVRSELAAMGLDWIDRRPTPELSKIPRVSSAPAAPIAVEMVGLSRDELSRTSARFHVFSELHRLRGLLTFRLNSADAYHERSHHWGNLGQWAAAKEDAERACRERDDNAHWFATLGEYAYQAGDDSAALPALARAITLDPNDLQSRNTLAWALLLTATEKRDPARALELTDQLIKAQPENLYFRNTRLLALSRLGQDAAAVAMVDPNAPAMAFDLLVLAPCRYRVGEMELARNSLDRFVAWRRSAQMTPRQAHDIDLLIAEARSVLTPPADPEDAGPR
jgi:tetratricopeptide (TPR) repeat protein